MKLQICGLNIQFIFENRLKNKILFKNLYFFETFDNDKISIDYKIFVFKYIEPTNSFALIKRQFYYDYFEKIFIKKQFFCFFIKNTKNVILCIKEEKLFFNNFLRIFLSTVLIKKKGFLLHASGILEKNNAYIFSGLSGAGKTTIAKKFKKVYSDDIIGVRKIENKYTIFPTPFWGELGISKKIIEHKPNEINAVFFIEKSRQNIIRDIEKKIAYKKLLRNILFFGKDINELMINANDFVNKNNFFYLKLNKKILKQNIVLNLIKNL